MDSNVQCTLFKNSVKETLANDYCIRHKLDISYSPWEIGTVEVVKNAFCVLYVL